MGGSFIKQPYEEFQFPNEWAGKLPTGASLSTAALSAVDEDGNDASTLVLQSTTGTISGTQVIIGVKAGAAGKKYKITDRVVLSNADKLEDDIWMYVEEK